ncbi:MAG TPA: F0F1 ATP synthase subunit B [Candidatus Binatia bacterium]|nr:F0F1 ATP synthase subunit B [Candidatus Binatia bacterium]
MDLNQFIIAATEVVAQVAEEAHAEEGGPLGTLGINWKLFLAQLINFSVVLFVFWKWVVKPLGKTLTDRQEKIESGLKNAVYMEDEKKKFEEWKKEEMQKVRTEAEKVLKTATETADKIKQETVTTAQTQAGKMIEQAKSAIDNEKTQMLKDVKASVAELVVLASEKILKEKLDSKKDHELVNESIKELK